MFSVNTWLRILLLSFLLYRCDKSNLCGSLRYLIVGMCTYISSCFYISTSFLYSYMIHPCMEMCKTIVKRRSYNLRSLVLLQIFIYALYWFALNENATQYLYMLKVFDGFNGESMAHFQIVIRIFGKYT